MFSIPSSSVFLLAYFKLEILRSIAKILEFLYKLAAYKDCCPVPHPAINTLGSFIFFIDELITLNLVSVINSAIESGNNLKCELIHLG